MTGNNDFHLILGDVDGLPGSLFLKMHARQSGATEAFERTLTRTGQTCEAFGSDIGSDFPSQDFQEILQDKGLEGRTRGAPNPTNALVVVDN